MIEKKEVVKKNKSIKAPILDKKSENKISNIKKNNKFTCLYFHNDNCGHCKTFKIIFEETIKSMDYMEFKIINSIDDYEKFIKYKITVTPTIIFLKDDKELEDIKVLGANEDAFKNSLYIIKDKIIKAINYSNSEGSK